MPSPKENPGRLEYSANVAASIPLHIPGVDFKSAETSLVEKNMAALENLPNSRVKQKEVRLPAGPLERDLYSPDQKKLTELTTRALSETDMVALQDVGHQIRTLLSLPIPEGAVFSRFVKGENGALTINYFTEKNPTASDLTMRGHESNSIAISM